MQSISHRYFQRPLYFSASAEPKENQHPGGNATNTPPPELRWHAQDSFDTQADDQIAQLVVQHQVDLIKGRTQEGDPFLSWTIKNRRPNLFNRLIAHFQKEPDKLKELVDQVDESGYSALHHGADLGDSQLVQTLLDAKANPNQATDLDELPIHFATSDSENDQHEMVDSFIRAQTNLTAQAHDGQTPLHRAAGFGLIKSAKKLIDALKHRPETLRIPDFFSKTPKQCAEDGGHIEIADYITQADPENDTPQTNKPSG